MSYRPRILDEEGMVVIYGGRVLSIVVLQDGGKVITVGHAVLAGANAPWIRRKHGTLTGAVGSTGKIVVAGDSYYHRLGDITVLTNNIPQTVVLITELEVVSSSPARLKVGEVLVELVVFARIHIGEAAIVRIGVCARQLQRHRLGGARVIGQSGCTNHEKVGTAGRPAEVVIVGKEISEARGRDQLRRKGDVSANIISGVGLGKADAARV